MRPVTHPTPILSGGGGGGAGRIRSVKTSVADPDPGSDFFPSRITDPNFFHPWSRILTKEFKYFDPKKWFLSSRKYDPGCSSRIWIPDPEPGSGSWLFTHPGSRIRTRNTGGNIALSFAGRDGPQASGNILINNEKPVARYTDRWEISINKKCI